MIDTFTWILIPVLIFGVVIRTLQYIMDRYMIEYLGSKRWVSKLSNAIIIMLFTAIIFITYYLIITRKLVFDLPMRYFLSISLIITMVQFLFDADVYGQWNKDWNVVIGLVLTVASYIVWYFLFF